MPQAKLNRYWAIFIIFLVAVIIITVFIAWTKYRPTKPIEILLPPAQEIKGNIYIDGAVNNPGIYSFSGEDSIGSLIQSAGGVADDGDSDSLELTIPSTNTQGASQKIDINHAGAWLLEALPGIGATKANAIIAYRQKNGLFRSVDELIKVDGISLTLLEQIRPLITISD